MNVLQLIALCLALSGCITETIIVKEPVEVPVPVPVPCIDEMPEVPEWATDYLKESDGLFEIGRTLMVELEQRRRYGLQLETLLQSCVAETSP